ncbi:unnamed protein product [Sphagnum jensenii]|uniref:Uncharacterized protein n=1 Tax=Sphagnum jensenii TaxID=128206 RepID=A0ABP1BEN2_9BRYO
MKITSADIEYINFDSDEIIAHGLNIFNCLQSNQTLEDLDIDVYDFVPLPVDSRKPLSLNKDGFGFALGDMLYSNKSLRKLRLSGCGEVGSEIGAEIARGLCNNATLQELNLGGNDLLAEGLRKLARGSIYSKCCWKQVQHLSELPEIELVCERKRSSGSAGQHAAAEHLPYVFGFLLGQCIESSQCECPTQCFKNEFRHQISQLGTLQWRAW